MWEVLSWLLLNYCILNGIIRIIGQFGRWWPHEYRYIRWACIRGVFSAIIIFTLASILQSKISIIDSFSQHTMFWVGVSIILACSILWATFLRYRSIPLMISMVIIGIVSFGAYYIWWHEWFLVTLLIAAMLEELIKAAKISYLYEHIPSDSIIWWLCCGLCFAWAENMIYIIMKVIELNSTTMLIIQRTITALPLHSILTGLIWYMLIKHTLPLYKKSIVIIAIILTHFAYNVATQQFPIFIIPSILTIYILWVRLIEKVDRLYIK